MNLELKEFLKLKLIRLFTLRKCKQKMYLELPKQRYFILSDQELRIMIFVS